ncbi:hypothetical protein RJ639_007125, partial [Escallonia herrerae]
MDQICYKTKKHKASGPLEKAFNVVERNIADKRAARMFYASALSFNLASEFTHYFLSSTSINPVAIKPTTIISMKIIMHTSKFVRENEEIQDKNNVRNEGPIEETKTAKKKTDTRTSISSNIKRITLDVSPLIPCLQLPKAKSILEKRNGSHDELEVLEARTLKKQSASLPLRVTSIALES